MYFMRSILSLFYSLIFFTFLFPCGAYSFYAPPYPAVWGYDLSELACMKAGEGKIQAYLMSDGDIWFLVSFSYPEGLKTRPHANEKPILIKFFKKEQKEISENEKNQLLNKIEIEGVKEILFKDKSKLSLYTASSPTQHFIPDFCQSYFIKTNSQRQTKSYSILMASLQIEIHQEPLSDSTQYPPFMYQRLQLLKTMIPLKDETFLVFDKNQSLILRLDKNLTTPFKPASSVLVMHTPYIERNFFIMDYTLIRHLIDEFRPLPGPIYQGIHNALFEYCHKIYPPST